MSRYAYVALPLIIFGILVVALAINLKQDPQKLKSALLGKPVPNFSLPPLEGRDTKGFKTSDLNDKISIINIFGSWCIGCLREHPFLMKLKTTKIIPIHGIDWREKDSLAGPEWLTKNGDPYDLVGDDPKGQAAIAFGVTGAPETFLVDKNGLIRYKQTGPLNEHVWDSTIFPIIQQLRME